MGCNNDYCEIEPREPKLKHCPFCGAEPFKWSWTYGTAVQCSKYHPDRHQVKVEAKTEREAVELWNHRAES